MKSSITTGTVPVDLSLSSVLLWINSRGWFLLGRSRSLTVERCPRKVYKRKSKKKKRIFQVLLYLLLVRIVSPTVKSFSMNLVFTIHMKIPCTVSPVMSVCSPFVGE